MGRTWLVALVIACGGSSNQPPPDAAPAADAAPDVIPPASIVIEKIGVGTGVVTSVPAGIDCGNTCRGNWPPGTQVKLTAAPHSFYLFSGWSGACSGTTPTCTITTTSEQLDVGVQFSQVKLRVKPANLEGGGTIRITTSVHNTQCAPEGCEIEAQLGTVATLTATPLAGSVLKSWSHPGCTAPAPCVVTLNTAVTEVAAPFGRDDSVDNGTTTFTATKEGTPIWDVTGWQLGSAYFAARYLENVQRLFTIADHPITAGAVVTHPGLAHGTTYEGEPAARFAALGWDSGNHFKQVDWAIQPVPGRMLMFAGVIVPGATAPTGSTRDYASGPMIPRNFGTLKVDADLYKDNVLVHADLDYDYPSLSATDPTSTEAGMSHMPVHVAETELNVALSPGTYRMHIHIYEAAVPANGWQIDVPFVIDP